MANQTRIKIELPEGWGDYTDQNPDGPPTYLRTASKVPGPLQISFGLYESGDIPDPSKEDLMDMARGLGLGHGWGDVISTASGECGFGRFGTAVFRSDEHDRIQVWYLCNGRDFIFATHICPEAPDPQEVEEADRIVKALTLEAKPKSRWRFW
jgi:hypothetical protein